MPPRTTVIVDLDTDAHGLVDLVRSLDAQSADTSDFEVIFTRIDTASDVGRRLALLAGRRPNVRVSDAPPADAVLNAQGSWVLMVSSQLCSAGIRLRPQALSRLVAMGETHGSDAVLGRVDVTADGRTCDLLVRDTARLDAVPVEALDPALVLYRREFADSRGVGSTASEIAAVLVAATVSGLGNYPAAQLAGKAEPGAAALTVTDVAAEWREGSAAITVSGRAAVGAADRLAVLSVRHLPDGLELLLSEDGRVDSDGAFSVTARLDPRTAALGEPLAPGQWAVRVGVRGREGAWSASVPVSGAHLGSAIIDGRLVAVDRDGPSLVLDVAATRGSVVGRLAARDIEIVETWQGTMLNATILDVAVFGTSQTSGHLLLGKFALPARLEAAGGAARVTCWLSGLAGRSSMSTRFGGPAAATGLDLVIDSVGVMTVVPTPPPAPKAPAKRAPQRTQKQAPARRPAKISRLRHAMPASFEPAVRSLARNPTARRVYRRLVGLRDR